MSATLEEKTGQLTEYHRELEQWLAKPRGPEWDPLLRRVLERMIVLLVDCAVDAGLLWLERHHHSRCDRCVEVFFVLARAGVLDDPALFRFHHYASARNSIVHYYDQPYPQLRADAESLASDISSLIQALLADRQDNS